MKNTKGETSELSKGLHRNDLIMSFQMKMLEFINRVNKELKQSKKERVKQNKFIKRLMRQEARPSSLSKKLAKVNLPSAYSGFEKASKGNFFILEMNNYYDV